MAFALDQKDILGPDLVEHEKPARGLFIHLFWSILWRLFKSTTTQRRSRLQHGDCIGVSRRSAQATVNKGLAQSPNVAARAGVEPTTLRLRVIDIMSHKL